MKFNLHTHTRFSDGSDEPIKYAEEAIRQGFHTLGFSDHSPVPFKNNFAIREGEIQEYVNSISGIRHPASLNILLGLEVEYIPGITQSFEYLKKNYPFDYLIGSVHLIRYGPGEELWFIDGPEIKIYDAGLREIFGGDIRKAVTAYFHQMNEMIATEKPDIIGHFDKIKMYNRGRYFSEDDDWYIRLVDESLQLIRETGGVIEVNTRGIYKKRSDSLFPGPAILKKIKSRNIPVILSSDAHKPFELSFYFSETISVLKEIGFKDLVIPDRKTWKEIPIDEF